MGKIMEDKSEILNALMEVIGEEGCGVTCEEAEVFKDVEGFMEPWYIGKTVEEAKINIREYALMGFGLS